MTHARSLREVSQDGSVLDENAGSVLSENQQTVYREVEAAYRISLKSLGRRYLELHDEIADLDVIITAIVEELAPNLIERNSIGSVGAAQLLLTAGGNPERLRSEASVAALCGVSPVPASSGKTVRHRLDRGGDRSATSVADYR